MNIRSMEVFCAVVNHGVMAKAADELNMTAAAVSRSINELESQLGKKLLNRTTRKLSVTPDGQYYFLEALKILDDLNNLHNHFESISTKVQGRIKIAAPMSYGLAAFAPVVAKFRSKFPGVIFDLVLEDSETDIISKGYDLALRIQRNIKNTSLIGKKIGEFDHHIVASPKLVKQIGVPNKPEDLSKYPCMSYLGSSSPEKWHLSKTGKKFLYKFSPIISVNNSQFLVDLSLIGEGICMAPSFLTSQSIKEKKLVELLPDYEKPIATCWVVYPSRKFQRPVVREFINHLSAETN